MPLLRTQVRGLAARPAARWLARRTRRLFGFAPRARQSLVALGLNSTTSLIAGAVLGSITGTLERFPGLLVLVPAAIGLRGNIFATFGSRLSTTIHTGEYEPSLRPGSILRQNIESSMVLTMFMSVVLAALAWALATAIGIENLSSPLQLATISLLGGGLASTVVLGASLLLVSAAVRYGWDLDNVVAPVVSVLGDVLTLPALWLATFVADPMPANVLGGGLAVLSVALFVGSARSRQMVLRRITRESWPVLTVAALLSTLAGLVLEQRLLTLMAFPALLMLQPAFVSSAGALGGVLSSRTASRLHLGLSEPAAPPGRDIRHDALFVSGLSLPVYVLNGGGAHLMARLVGEASPGLGPMLVVSLLGGIMAVGFALVVAYFGTVGTFRVGVDPDTYGIPMVTSAVDFGGAVALIAVAALLGVTVT